MTRGRGRRTALAVLVVSLATLVTATLLGWQREGGAASGTSTATRPTAAGSPPAVGADSAAAVVPGRERSEPPPTAQPVQLRVPAVGIRMRVVPKGVRPDGQMALPARPENLGWYRFGPAPREVGSTVLAGHVDSDRFGVGPLARLQDARPGQVLLVRLSDGSTVRYRTVSVRDIAKSSGGLASVFDRDGRARLRVVTCGGAYDAARGGYQDNVVLTAVPVPAGRTAAAG